MEPERYVGDDLKPTGPAEVALVMGRNEVKVAVETYQGALGARYVQIERAFWLLPRDKRIKLNMKENEMSAFKIKGRGRGVETRHVTLKLPKDKGEQLDKLAKNYGLTTPELVMQCLDYALENLDPVQQVNTRRKQGE